MNPHSLLLEKLYTCLNNKASSLDETKWNPVIL